MTTRRGEKLHSMIDELVMYVRTRIDGIKEEEVPKFRGDIEFETQCRNILKILIGD